MGKGKRQQQNKKNKKQGGFIKHLKNMGFTNRYAVYLLLFLVAGLMGGFYLAILSIRYQYTGALACWTVVFTPIGTAIGIVLGKIVDKSKAENVSGNGDGIKFASAKANNFNQEVTGSIDSPAM